MRPRLRLAIADAAADSTASLSRWTHRVGVSGGMCDGCTPTRNAIGLGSPVEFVACVGDGRAKPVAFHPPPSFVTEAFQPPSQGEAKSFSAQVSTEDRGRFHASGMLGKRLHCSGGRRIGIASPLPAPASSTACRRIAAGRCCAYDAHAGDTACGTDGSDPSGRPGAGLISRRHAVT